APGSRSARSWPSRPPNTVGTTLFLRRTRSTAPRFTGGSSWESASSLIARRELRTLRSRGVALQSTLSGRVRPRIENRLLAAGPRATRPSTSCRRSKPRPQRPRGRPRRAWRHLALGRGRLDADLGRRRMGLARRQSASAGRRYVRHRALERPPLRGPVLRPPAATIGQLQP